MRYLYLITSDRVAVVSICVDGSTAVSYSSLCVDGTAELLLHSERVSRHISSVEQALSELSEGLEVLSDNQNERVDRLIDDVTRLDRLYTAANKTSRCVAYFLTC